MKKTITHSWKWINTIWVEHPDTGKIWEWVERKWIWKVVGAFIENISRETFVVVEQFRPLMDMRVIELVAGLIDDWNTPEQAIAKEILEETWYRAEQIEYLFQGPKSAGITTEQTLDYYVKVSWKAWKQQLEASEQWLIVYETHNRLSDLKKFLISEEKSGKLVSPWIWAAVGKALIDGKIKAVL